MRRTLSRGFLAALGCTAGCYGIHLGSKKWRGRLVRCEGGDADRSKKLEEQYGYDMLLKDVKRFSEAEQSKLRPSAKTRGEHLAELKNPANTFDVLVVGGGCNGSGVLLDASTRGLYCALIDRGDFSSETSSRSTKLIHGGVRYLQEVFSIKGKEPYQKWKLVVEGLDERNFMLNSGAYMNKKVEMVIPCKNAFYLVYYLAGVCFYHFLSYFKWCFSDYSYRLPRPGTVSKAKMREIAPQLKDDCYGVRFAEGQMNDARLVIQNLLTSSIDNYVDGMKGAVLANYVEFVDFLKDGSGKIVGAVLFDRLENSKFEVKAKVVVNCAGAFADNLRLKDDPQVKPRILASRGVHMIIPHKYTERGIGVLIPKTADGRVMFVLPYQGLTIAGTTDHPCKIESAPSAPESDIDEIAACLGNYFKGDIKKECSSAWCGIRPLVVANEKPASFLGKYWRALKGKLSKNSSSGDSSKSLTRSHEVEISRSGLISLLGGKWTAYRRMGEDAVDTVLQNNPQIAPVHKSSISRGLRLTGGYTSKTFEKKEEVIHEFIDPYSRFMHEKYGLEWDTCQHYIQCYGSHAVLVARRGSEAGMNERLHKDLPCTKMQVVHAVRYEQAVTVRDVVFRRLGVGFTSHELAEAIIPLVASVMSSELGWSRSRKAEEIAQAKAALKTLS